MARSTAIMMGAGFSAVAQFESELDGTALAHRAPTPQRASERAGARDVPPPRWLTTPRATQHYALRCGRMGVKR
jgi:hypothetical protein